MWRVLEQNHHNCIANKDSDYDKITEFKNESKANYYYTSVFNSNYRTILQKKVNDKWEYRASSCCSEFI